MTDYGIGYTIFKFENGTKTPMQMFKGHPGNVKRAMAELQKHLDRIGKHPMAITAIMLTGAYSFAIRLLIEVF